MGTREEEKKKSISSPKNKLHEFLNLYSFFQEGVIWGTIQATKCFQHSTIQLHLILLCLNMLNPIMIPKP